jgi:hypothetical protein
MVYKVPPQPQIKCLSGNINITLSVNGFSDTEHEQDANKEKTGRRI